MWADSVLLRTSFVLVIFSPLFRCVRPLITTLAGGQAPHHFELKRLLTWGYNGVNALLGRFKPPLLSLTAADHSDTNFFHVLSYLASTRAPGKGIYIRTRQRNRLPTLAEPGCRDERATAAAN